MKTTLQKLGTKSDKKEFAEPIHSESSFQEAETTSEKTELADQRALQKHFQPTIWNKNTSQIWQKDY